MYEITIIMKDSKKERIRKNKQTNKEILCNQNIMWWMITNVLVITALPLKLLFLHPNIHTSHS